MITDALAPPSPATPPENYERYFVPSIGLPAAKELIRIAALQPGERVLDVGCGTGVATRLAREEVGAGPVVAGLDPNPGMLAVARAVTPDHLAIEWHLAPAESMSLPDGAFDVVLAAMSLQFMPDRTRALGEMRRVLDRGGRIALSVPGPAAPPFEILADALARHVAGEAAGFLRAVFGLHEEGELEVLLGNAGFRKVDVRAETYELALPGPADFLRQYIWSTPLAAAVGVASPASRAALEREVVQAWQRFAQGGGMRLRQRMVTAVARLPA